MKLNDIKLRFDRKFIYLLIIISMIPVLSDWNYKGINFGDVLVVLSMLTIVKQLGIRELVMINLKWYVILPIIITLVNVSFHLLTSSNYELLIGFYFVTKLSLYVIFVNSAYYYINSINQLSTFFTINILVGSLIVIIGILISLLLLSGSKIPQDIFWTFTRSDKASFIFRGTSIVRLRSFFSEPSYLGIYLNLLLSVFLFRCSEEKTKIEKIQYISLMILMLGVILTFSFSAIITMSFILFLYIIKNYTRIIRMKWLTYTALIALLAIVVIFRNQIYQTIIVRTLDILSGKDTSSLNRIFGSWKHIRLDNLLFGNGIGKTPPIWNNLAYVLSDLGLIPFLLFLYGIFSVYRRNKYLSIMFVIFSFQRGGYLNNYYWYSILMVMIFSVDKSKKKNIGHLDETKYLVTVQNRKSTKKYSFLVPTLGERINQYTKLLQSLDMINRNDFEIVVINQGDNNHFEKINDSFPNLDIIMIHSNEKGISKARNLGLKNARGEIILLSDDDCYYNKDVLKILDNAFSNNVNVVISQIMDSESDNKYKAYSNNEKKYINSLELTSISSIEIAFRIESIKFLFDENLGVGSPYKLNATEEVDFLISNYESNTYKYIPVVTVYHEIKRVRDESRVMAKGYLYAKHFGIELGILVILRDFVIKKQNNFKQFVKGYNIYRKL